MTAFLALVGFLTALGTSLVLAPAVRNVARRRALAAAPRSDRWHEGPTAFIGDPHKGGRLILGVPVAGGRDRVQELLSTGGTDEVISTAETAAGRCLRDLRLYAIRCGWPCICRGIVFDPVGSVTTVH